MVQGARASTISSHGIFPEYFILSTTRVNAAHGEATLNLLISAYEYRIQLKTLSSAMLYVGLVSQMVYELFIQILGEFFFILFWL